VDKLLLEQCSYHFFVLFVYMHQSKSEVSCLYLLILYFFFFFMYMLDELSKIILLLLVYYFGYTYMLYNSKIRSSWYYQISGRCMNKKEYPIIV
jgi:hypothetical protein